jgi:hypothetical protein
MHVMGYKEADHMQCYEHGQQRLALQRWHDTSAL